MNELINEVYYYIHNENISSWCVATRYKSMRYVHKLQLYNCFHPLIVQNIIRIRLSNILYESNWIWGLTPKGSTSDRSGYHFVMKSEHNKEMVGLVGGWYVVKVPLQKSISFVEVAAKHTSNFGSKG